jgi:hypothetical protein
MPGTQAQKNLPEIGQQVQRLANQSAGQTLLRGGKKMCALRQRYAWCIRRDREKPQSILLKRIAGAMDTRVKSIRDKLLPRPRQVPRIIPS